MEGPVELDDGRVAMLFAAAGWSTIAEPGDAIAGLVVLALGVDRSLSMLIERRTAGEWLAVMPEAVGEILSESDLEAAIERWTPRLASRLVVAALRAAAKVGATLLVPDDPLWPSGFDALGVHAPLALWVRGDPSALEPPGGAIAIVGSRDATNYGEHMAMDLASGLSDRGFTVVSGAAYGIDGMAHRATLASRGTTVAYLAGGVDRLYPTAHHDLLLRVAHTGAVASELPCGAAPTRWRFLQRNRLIAAASQATVVVEAGHRSGSLNTAGHAASMGRPLGAVPGPVTSASSAGCHRLLREYDAVCVTSASDVVELVLGPPAPDSPPPPSSPPDPPPPPSPPTSPMGSSKPRSAPTPPVTPRRWLPSIDPNADGEKERGRRVASSRERTADATRVLDAMSHRSARRVDDLARRTGMSPRSVSVNLGVLTLESAVHETPGGWLRT